MGTSLKKPKSEACAALACSAIEVDSSVVSQHASIREVLYTSQILVMRLSEKSNTEWLCYLDKEKKKPTKRPTEYQNIHISNTKAYLCTRSGDSLIYTVCSQPTSTNSTLMIF